MDALLCLTEAEGWLCDRREFMLYQRLNLAMGLVIVDGARVIGCVTAFVHSHQAWVGNLIVHPELRGRGLGTALLEKAIDWISKKSIETILLTSASRAETLYRRLGFKSLHNIYRWQRPAVPGGCGVKLIGDRYNLRRVIELDSACWSDDRTRLIKIVQPERICLVGDDQTGFLMIGPVGNILMMGPGAISWPAGVQMECLIEKALERTAPGKEIVLDTFANRSFSKVLDANGFSIKSSTILMYRGLKPDIKFNQILATASLGAKG